MSRGLAIIIKKIKETSIYADYSFTVLTREDGTNNHGVLRFFYKNDAFEILKNIEVKDIQEVFIAGASFVKIKNIWQKTGKLPEETVYMS